MFDFSFATDALLSITLAVMIISLVVMVILPVLPGQLGIWLAATIYFWIESRDAEIEFRWGLFLILTILVLIALVLDQIAGWWGARHGGASWSGLILGLVAGIVGLIFFNAIGAILGFLLGMVGYEYFLQRDWQHAFSTAKGYLLGQLVSLVARLAIAVGMVVIFWMQVT